VIAASRFQETGFTTEGTEYTEENLISVYSVTSVVNIST